MSVFDDGQHGVLGMTYKYHERAIVFNERNLHKVWDIAYDGYCSGKDVQMVNMKNPSSKSQFIEEMNDYSKDYNGPSIVPILLEPEFTWLVGNCRSLHQGRQHVCRSSAQKNVG